MAACHPTQSPVRAAPHSLCPACSMEAGRWHVVAESGITTAYYLCDREHAWLVKWGDA